MKKLLIILLLISIVYFGWKLGRPLFFDDSVNEELPEDFVELGLPTPEEFEGMGEKERLEVEIKMVEMFSKKETVVKETMPTGPTLINSGNFKDADNFHKGSGLAKLLKNNSGHLLRFEDFMVTNGPQLHVYLATGSDPKDHDSLGEYIDLGPLKGNIGNQNYNIDPDIDVSKYKSVVIYCVPFRVVFSVANLK